MNKHQLFQLFKTSFKNWQVNNDPLRAAALTFFIILPLPSILLIVETVFALFYGQSHASQLLIQQIASFAGPAVAELFRELLASAMSPFVSVWGAVTVVAFSLGGAVGAFAVLRGTMDVIWEVKVKPRQKFSVVVAQRIGPFLVISALGLIVIGWTAAASILFRTITHYSASGGFSAVSVDAAQALSTFGLSLLLFALTYKLIPDARVHWRDVGLPSVVAGLAFTVTNYIIGTYVETFTVTTVIGAAGSLLIILLWIFIVNQIMLFGAELSKVYATTSGEHAREHLPPAAEKIFRSFERAGERIEEAAKGQVEEEPAAASEAEEPSRKHEQQTATAPTGKEESEAEKSEAERSGEAHPQPPQKPPEEGNPQATEAEEAEAPSVEVKVTIRGKRKKRNGES